MNGAKLKIGYINSGYHLKTVDNENQVITKDELVDGKLVSVRILDCLYLVTQYITKEKIMEFPPCFISIDFKGRPTKII